MAILIMGKYAYVKSSIILYHKQINLSIGFVKVFEKNLKKSNKTSGEPKPTA